MHAFFSNTQYSYPFTHIRTLHLPSITISLLTEQPQEQLRIKHLSELHFSNSGTFWHEQCLIYQSIHVY